MVETLKKRAQEARIPWTILLKEALQVFFLEVFYSLEPSAQATFQGGTALRLLYGGPRHSEDLDFVTDQPGEYWEALRPTLYEKLKTQASLLGGDLALTSQKPSAPILRWKLKWRPLTGSEAVWVRAEFARYPAYTRELMPLARPAGFPIGAWMVIPTESREEILADKLAAIGGRPYLKARDFFDLWFLTAQKVGLKRELLKKKFNDYRVDPRGLKKRLDQVNGRLLSRELKSFLPYLVRRPLEEDNYASVLRVSKEILTKALKLLER